MDKFIGSFFKAKGAAPAAAPAPPAAAEKKRKAVRAGRAAKGAGWAAAPGLTPHVGGPAGRGRDGGGRRQKARGGGAGRVRLPPVAGGL